MEKTRGFLFDRTIIEQFYFDSTPEEGEIKTDFFFAPEYNDEDKNKLRVYCELKMLNKDLDKEFLKIETYSYFLISDNFGEFNPKNKTDQEIVQSSFRDIKFLANSIIRNTAMNYLDLDLSIDYDDLDAQEK